MDNSKSEGEGRGELPLPSPLPLPLGGSEGKRSGEGGEMEVEDNGRIGDVEREGLGREVILTGSCIQRI